MRHSIQYHVETAQLTGSNVMQLREIDLKIKLPYKVIVMKTYMVMLATLLLLCVPEFILTTSGISTQESFFYLLFFWATNMNPSETIGGVIFKTLSISDFAHFMLVIFS